MSMISPNEITDNYEAVATHTGRWQLCLLPPSPNGLAIRHSRLETTPAHDDSVVSSPASARGFYKDHFLVGTCLLPGQSSDPSQSPSGGDWTASALRGLCSPAPCQSSFDMNLEPACALDVREIMHINLQQSTVS